MGYIETLVDFFLLGGWILIVPALFVLGCTAYVLIMNAVDRHRASKEHDMIDWERHTQP